jgi:hypothetical protein
MTVFSSLKLQKDYKTVWIKYLSTVKKWGMEINTDKTKSLVFNSTENFWEIINKQFKQVGA